MANKKIFVFMALFLFVCPTVVFADVATRDDFNGTWIGAIVGEEEETSATPNLKIVITNGKVSQYFKDSSGAWYAVEPDDARYLWTRNNLIYAWVNQGGVWSETQTFSLSLINSGTLDLVWSRHVNNYSEDSDNETWRLVGKGSLTKEGSSNSGGGNSGSGNSGSGGCDVGTGLGFAVFALAAAPLLRKWQNRNRP
jgi:hypothetical protein